MGSEVQELPEPNMEDQEQAFLSHSHRLSFCLTGLLLDHGFFTGNLRIAPGAVQGGRQLSQVKVR